MRTLRTHQQTAVLKGM
ncbi:hypothetical protein CGLO_01189 [Colletotrichum gloeosporioides Cg-14]|uniref:Uncharacterized protein n=1 Tax=Colletotrichum gloeosporioides (strain Cg-14) TaxID=1237896 RepID=T0M4U3_COLGC|nr:hypothetical protein CGLO_01189 [Colletotrichum gloeosporioides Cg-14]